MILSFAHRPMFLSSARKGFSAQLLPVPAEQRRILDGSCRGQHWPPRLEYSYHPRIRALSTDDSAKINTISSGQLELVLPRKSEEQHLLDSNRSPYGEFFELLEALCLFTRPYAMIGTVIMVTSISFLPLTSLAEASPAFFVEVFKAMVPLFLSQVYASGINQIYDVEIDKVNKPYLPLVSGAFSMEFGIVLTSMSLLGSLATGIMFRSPPLLFCAVLGCLLGSAYAIDLPFLRWKRSPLLTSTSIMVARAIAIPFATFIHIQKYVLGRPILFTKSLIFAACFSFFFSFVVGLCKDIPDIDGDRLFGCGSSLACRLGQKKVFWICISILMLIYGCAMGVGFSSSFLLSKLVIVLSHFLLACIVLYRALSLDLSAHAFYMFVWKLMYAEYLLIPFVR